MVQKGSKKQKFVSDLTLDAEEKITPWKTFPKNK